MNISVTISGKGYTLSGTLVLPKMVNTKLPAVIFYHGMVSKSKPRNIVRAEKLAKHGIIGFAFDFRGCGESDGKLGELSLKDWLNDALLAYDFLKNDERIDNNRIGITGKSFGGYMAALVSKKRQTKSMVLHAPAVYDDEWFEKIYDWKNEEFMDIRKDYRKSKAALNNKALNAISLFTNPLLVVGSEKDDVCPQNVVEGYYTHANSENKEIKWIKNADHALSKDSWNNEFTDMMVAWFTQTL